MGVMVYKVTSLFFLITVSLLSTSFAGREWKFVDKHVLGASSNSDKIPRKSLRHEEDAAIVHERLLRANTKDYGRYDPAPTLGKPRFKLIPN